MPIVPRETLVDVVEERASTNGSATWLRHLVSGDVAGPVVELNGAELARRAAAIAVGLERHGKPGDRALVAFPSGPHFATAFIGCMYAGMIPVPVQAPYLATREQGAARLAAIAADCGARLALTTSDALAGLHAVTPPWVEWIATDSCDPGLASAWRRPPIDGEAIALVQYTSGSTGAPKGVVVRHRQLLANELSIEAAIGPVDTVVGWLPVFHDMGLIGNVLQTLCSGSSLVLMSPMAFLKRPARWLEAISHFRATTSGSPNFGYDLCVRRVTDEEKAGLDLSSWKVAYCGAEPVRVSTYCRFCAAFEPRGFRASAFYPCYGLAEATLFVAGGTRGTAPMTGVFRGAALDRGNVVVAEADDEGSRTLVSCGGAMPSEEICVVDTDRREPTDEVGEIWVRGPGVASGYWGRLETDDGVFGAMLADGRGPFLRTGDLGFVHGAELYISGRRKELIILGGRNLFPQDIEATVESAVPSIRPGASVAFSIEHGDSEKLVIMAEHGDTNGPEVIRSIKQAVAEHHQASAFDVVLVPRGFIPKTSSGKLERYACREAYLRGVHAH